MNLNIMNIRTKKLNSFSLFDLIGFQPNPKKDLKQLSLSNLMLFLAEILKNKDNINVYRKNFLKNPMRNLLNNKQTNFINLFATHFFNSHTSFFVLAGLKQDTYQNSHSLYDKLSE